MFIGISIAEGTIGNRKELPVSYRTGGSFFAVFSVWQFRAQSARCGPKRAALKNLKTFFSTGE